MKSRAKTPKRKTTKPLKIRDHLQSISHSLQMIRGEIAGINNSSNLAAENMQLRDENRQLRNVKARNMKLEDENTRLLSELSRLRDQFARRAASAMEQEAEKEHDNDV